MKTSGQYPLLIIIHETAYHVLEFRKVRFGSVAACRYRISSTAAPEGKAASQISTIPESDRPLTAMSGRSRACRAKKNPATRAGLDA